MSLLQRVVPWFYQRKSMCQFLADDCIPKIVLPLIRTWNFPQCEWEFHTMCMTTVQEGKKPAVLGELFLGSDGAPVILHWAKGLQDSGIKTGEHL